MLTTDEIQDGTHARHRRLVPPLWTLWLGLVLLVTGGFYLILWHPFQVRTRFVSELESAGISVEYEEAGPQWIRDLTGSHMYGFAGNPKHGGLFDRVSRISVCSGGRPATVPKKIPFEVVQRLATFPSLKHLDLTYSNVTDDWMPAIGRLKSLEKLELGHARVCGRGFGQLRNLSKLKELNLVYCPVRDEYLGHLVRMRALKRLSLFRCSHVTTSAVLEFEQARPDCHVHLDSHQRISVTRAGRGDRL